MDGMTGLTPVGSSSMAKRAVRMSFKRALVTITTELFLLVLQKGPGIPSMRAVAIGTAVASAGSQMTV
jgi:hypothetical protein